MDNYIVRIYRKDAKNPQLIAGVVEIAGTDKTVPFSSLSELNGILSVYSEKEIQYIKTEEKE